VSDAVHTTHPAAEMLVLAPQQLPPYLRFKPFTQLFGLSDEWLFRHIAMGDIRAVKAGRATLIETASVLEYLQRRPVRLTRKGAARAVAA
jgi:predicted DNA-binding transcriptional regulator AlpA